MGSKVQFMFSIAFNVLPYHIQITEATCATEKIPTKLVFILYYRASNQNQMGVRVMSQQSIEKMVS